MKKFEKNIDDRKVLVARISQLTGVDARYTFVPRDRRFHGGKGWEPHSHGRRG